MEIKGAGAKSRRDIMSLNKQEVDCNKSISGGAGKGTNLQGFVCFVISNGEVK